MYHVSLAVQCIYERCKDGDGKEGSELSGGWIGYGGYVIWPLIAALGLKIGDLLWLFHCTRVKESELNGRFIEVLAC